MKRIIILLTIVLCTYTAIQAQKGFHVGAVGAFNTSWILSQNNFETLFDCSDPLIQRSEMAYEITPAFHAGGAIGYNFEDRHGLEINLLYVQAGQNYEDQYTSSLCPEFSDVRREIDLEYFQLPLLYRYSNGPPRGWFRWFVSAGPQLGFTLRATEMVWISDVEKTNFQVSEEEKFKSFDLGLSANAGIMYFIKEEFFLSAALATYVGALDLNGQPVQDFISLNDVKYRQSRNARIGLQIGIHYFFADHRRNIRW